MTGRAHTRADGAHRLARLAEGDWPSPATVTDLYATWAAARADVFGSWATTVVEAWPKAACVRASETRVVVDDVAAIPRLRPLQRCPFTPPATGRAGYNR
jgi:hypothetical protein